MLRLLKNWTFLRIYFLIYILCCLVFTVLQWKTLSQAEGWGVVYMIGLISIGLIGLLADVILNLLIKNKKVLNAVGILIAIGFSIMLLIELI